MDRSSYDRFSGEGIDDREKFEATQVHQDYEGDSLRAAEHTAEVLDLMEALRDSLRLPKPSSEGVIRLDPGDGGIPGAGKRPPGREGRYHGSGEWTGADSLESFDPEAVNEVDASTGLVMPPESAIGPHPELAPHSIIEALDGQGPAIERRFGDRLRDLLQEEYFSGTEEATGAALDVAAAIDQDRDKYRMHLLSLCADQEAEHLGVLRRQIEEAVERESFNPRGSTKRFVAVHNLKHALDGIFGERQAGLLDGMEVVLADFLPWALATFPDSTPKSCAAHLRKEAEELLAHPTDRGEIADILFLAVDLCQRAGFKPAEVMRGKLAELRTRTWGEPDADGVVEHLREHKSARDRQDHKS